MRTSIWVWTVRLISIAVCVWFFGTLISTLASAAYYRQLLHTSAIPLPHVSPVAVAGCGLTTSVLLVLVFALLARTSRLSVAVATVAGSFVVVSVGACCAGVATAIATGASLRVIVVDVMLDHPTQAAVFYRSEADRYVDAVLDPGTHKLSDRFVELSEIDPARDPTFITGRRFESYSHLR